jgi:hypothetical protein
MPEYGIQPAERRADGCDGACGCVPENHQDRAKRENTEECDQVNPGTWIVRATSRVAGIRQLWNLSHGSSPSMIQRAPLFGFWPELRAALRLPNSLYCGLQSVAMFSVGCIVRHSESVRPDGERMHAGRVCQSPSANAAHLATSSCCPIPASLSVPAGINLCVSCSAETHKANCGYLCIAI